MKKNLFLALAASVMMLTACSSKDEEPFGAARPNAHRVELNFDLSVNSGVESRGGRELWSSEALQSVKYVDIYVFGTDRKFVQKLSTKDNTLAATGDDFADKTNEMSTESHTYRFSTNLAAGKYTFIAVGYEEDAPAYTIAAPIAGTTTMSDMLMKLSEGQVEEEVFVGRSIEYTIGSEAASLNAQVTLHRAVAGILAYFKHIPYEVAISEGENVQITRVAVTVAGKANEVKMPTTANGTATTAGTAVSEPYEILSFNMKGQTKDGNNNWYAINSWDPEGAGPSDENKVTKETNSVLGGHFVLPFSRKSETNTMEVKLYYEKDGKEEVAKTYPVYCTQEDTKEGVTTQTTKTTKFNIYANHFYGLGQKYYNDPKNPGNNEDPDNPDPTPDDDDPDPDDPIDLSAVEYITITVKAAWNTIHHLGFDL